MEEDHLDYEALNRFLNGTFDRAGNMRVVRHLLTDCKECRRRARELTVVHPGFSEPELPSPKVEDADFSPSVALKRSC
jgi:hypothetical protein